MFNRLNLLAAAATALLIGACAAPPQKVAECVFPNSNQAAPGWICDAPVEGMAVTAVGSAAKSDAGLDFMKQMASTAARVQLAQQMQVQVENMIKQYAETTGAGSRETVDRVNTSVTKQITSQTLQGTRIVRSLQGPDGTLYVLVGADPATTELIARNAIRTSMSNDQAAWQQFKAQKGQEELATDIARLSKK